MTHPELPSSDDGPGASRLRIPGPRPGGSIRTPADAWWYLGAIVLGAVLIVIASLRQPFNQNELQQMAPYGSDRIADIVGGTRQPPLDPLAGGLVQHLLGTGQLQQRLVPVLAGIGTLIVVSLLLSHLRLGRAGAFAVLVLATSPLMIRYSAYTRPYATPVFLMVLFIYATQRWLDDRRPGWLAISFLAAIALPLTRVPEPTVFLATSAAVLVLLGLGKRLPWRSVWPVVVTCVAALVLVGFPLYRSLQQQASVYARDEHSDTLSAIRPGLYHIKTTVLPLVMEWFPWWPVILGVVAAALVLRDSRRWLLGYWAWWAALAAPVAWLVFYHFFTAIRLESVPYRPRYLYLFLPAFVLLVAAVVHAVSARRSTARAWRLGLSALLVAALVGQLPATVKVLREDEDPDFGLAGKVITEQVPADAIMLYDNPNPPGRYRHPFIGASRYLGDDAPRVLSFSAASKHPEALSDGPVYVLLLDRRYAATLFDNPTSTWTADVPGWQSQRHGRFVLYRPIRGQSGRDGVLRASREFGVALGPVVGFPEWWAAIRLLRSDGQRAEARAVFEQMYEATDPDDLPRLARQTRRFGPKPRGALSDGNRASH